MDKAVTYNTMQTYTCVMSPIMYNVQFRDKRQESLSTPNCYKDQLRGTPDQTPEMANQDAGMWSRDTDNW